MSRPTPLVWDGVKVRDGGRCVSCGRPTSLEFQHRQATGMGGSSIRPLAVDGLTACTYCNADYERELQTKALHYGWKVRKWVRDCALVPVFYPCELAGGWWRFAEDYREPIPDEVAHAMMTALYGDEWTGWHAQLVAKGGRIR